MKESQTEVDAELDRTKGKLKGKKGKEEKGKKDQSKKGSKKSKDTKEIKTEVTLESKEVQTPKIYPGEEVVLSEDAQLGKDAYETLNLGQELNEVLLNLMLAEYMKKFPYLKGFVLINYPQVIHRKLPQFEV